VAFFGVLYRSFFAYSAENLKKTVCAPHHIECCNTMAGNRLEQLVYSKHVFSKPLENIMSAIVISPPLNYTTS
jgi:hypothetical protein